MKLRRQVDLIVADSVLLMTTVDAQKVNHVTLTEACKPVQFYSKTEKQVDRMT